MNNTIQCPLYNILLIRHKQLVECFFSRTCNLPENSLGVLNGSVVTFLNKRVKMSLACQNTRQEWLRYLNYDVLKVSNVLFIFKGPPD